MVLRRSLFRKGCAARFLRARQRGSAIFIVLLVLTILTAIGVFAAQAAGLNQRSSGYARQSTQTGYVADYATLNAIDEITIGSNGPKPYVDQMVAGVEPCVSNMYIDGGVDSGIPCLRLFSETLQTRLAQAGSTTPFFDIDGGSLGPSAPYNPTVKQPGNAQGDFLVELTDPGQAGPVPGTDQGGTGISGTYVSLTVTGIGQVRPRTAAQDCQTDEDLYASQAAGTKTTRAIVKVGPIFY